MTDAVQERAGLGFCLVWLLVASATGGAAEWRAMEQPDLRDRIVNAKPLKVEFLDVPVKTTTRGELMWVPNPDGKTWDLLQWYWPGYGGPTEVVIVDLGTGEVKKSGIRRGQQIHICGRALAPNGKLYITTPKWTQGMWLYVYDPAANTIADKGLIVPDLTGERRPMAVGPDGMIYGSGSYMKEKKVGLYRIDPEMDKVTIYGAVGPSHAPGGVWAGSIVVDERYIYVDSGQVPHYLVVYDRETGTDRILLETEKVGGRTNVFEGIHKDRFMPSAWGRKVIGTEKDTWYWLKDGKVIPRKERSDTPPEGLKANPHLSKGPPKPEIYRENSEADVDGNCEIWVRPVETKAKAPADPAGAEPEDLGWRAFRYTVSLDPQYTHRLVELPDGRLFGTAGAYQGNFIHDPKTGTSRHLGKIHLSHYSTAILDGKVYMSGYGHSPLYVYDPARPWTANARGKPGAARLKDSDPKSNPRRCGSFHADTRAHKMYGAAVGADGRVYFGGRWYRQGNGGGFGWWDPTTQKTGGMWKQFSNYQITHITAAAEGRYIVISTRGARDTLLNKPTPEQGRLFVFDTQTQAIVRTVDPVPKCRGAGPVVGVGGARVIGWTVNPEDAKIVEARGRKRTIYASSILYGVEVETGEVAFRKIIPFPLPVKIGSNQKERFDFRLGPDGNVWTFIDDVLVRIHPEDARVEVLGATRFSNWNKPDGGGRMAFSGRDIYLAGHRPLRRIRSIVPSN